MIFVTLGTQNKSFERLLKAIEKEIERGNIDDDVIVQAGTTIYKSDKMKIFDMIPMKKFDDLLEKADYIICHGGVGTILNALKKEKKVLAVPRLSKYREHVNDHQKQIVEQFVKDKYILTSRNLEHIGKDIDRLKKFTPNKYSGSNKRMISIIEDFIGEV